MVSKANIDRLKRFSKGIHTEAKKLWVADKKKEPYKHYVKVASAKLKEAGFFNK